MEEQEIIAEACLRFLECATAYVEYVPRWDVFFLAPTVQILGANEAMDRSLDLLKAWLNPKQLKQFETHGYFNVIGSSSGKTYRLVSDTPNYNVHELKGDVVCDRYCVIPEGIPWTGDRLLAQKIWLETDEESTLAVANKAGMWNFSDC